MNDRIFNPFPVLKTPGLILRQLKISDDNEILALRSSDSVNKFLDREPAKLIDDAKAFIQTILVNIQSNTSIYWAITFGNDKLIGTTCLFNFFNKNKNAEIGYELLPGYQGRGIMQEAILSVCNYSFQEIGLQSIDAHCHRDNNRSIRLLEKCKFKRHKDGSNNFIIYRLTSDI